MNKIDKVKPDSGWKELPIGGTLPASSALDYKTGAWRSFVPKFNPNECTHCMICVHFCPVMAIPTKIDENGVIGWKDKIYKGVIRLETNLDYCTGCGVCAEECPTKAITMERETWEAK